MEVKQTIRLAACMLCLAPFVSFAHPQSEQSKYNPAPKRERSENKNGFIDFTLHRVNSADLNYGNYLDEGRMFLLRATIKETYFWSNVVSLGALTCVFGIVVFQHRILAKRELAVAELLVQYQNALARSNAQIEDAANKNRTLTDSLIALHDASSTLHFPVRDHAEKAFPRAFCDQKASTPASTTLATSERRHALRSVAADVVPPAAGSQIALFKPEVELVSKVNALEQQLGRSHELERRLRRQLDEAGKKLEAVQTRNRSVKSE